jgi:hypothetical protein
MQATIELLHVVIINLEAQICLQDMLTLAHTGICQLKLGLIIYISQHTLQQLKPGNRL